MALPAPLAACALAHPPLALATLLLVHALLLPLQGCLPRRPTPKEARKTTTGAGSDDVYGALHSPADADITGYNGMVQEERRVLLGDCQCPFINAGDVPYEGWSFDCADWDWRIMSELSPWHSMKLTPQAMDFAFQEVNTANIPVRTAAGGGQSCGIRWRGGAGIMLGACLRCCCSRRTISASTTTACS